jgi:hypothetical protein
VALPVGEAGAHQIFNSSNELLRYLCFSTMVEPDIAAYPHSEKIGLFAGAAPGGPQEERSCRSTYAPTPRLATMTAKSRRVTKSDPRQVPGAVPF